MALKANTISKLRTVMAVTLFGVIIGPLFTCIAFGFELDRAVKGLIAGFLITFLSGFFEKFVFENRFRKLNFTIVLLSRTLFYIFVITFSVIMVWVVHESMINIRGIIETVKTDDFRYFLTHGDFPNIFIFAITISFLMNFLLQLNNLLGKGVLLNYISGRYHKPKCEKRFFMFLDLESSTTIAETIGSLKYHEFINSFFFDISDPVIESRGEIYQYVGDEVVISWKKLNGIKNCNCVKCFFDIHDKIESLREEYIRKFGLIPGFKAGVHFGEVVIGEVGNSRKEIVFHGDVMNTASRVQNLSKQLNKHLLITDEAVRYLNTGKSYNVSEPVNYRLKGKETDTVIYEISKA